MQALRIRRQLDSETVPELKPWVGRNVEIIVMDVVPSSLPPGFKPGTGDWEAMRTAVEQLRDYDFNAVKDQFDCEMEHAQDHLP
jgi:hypothetical protein